MVENGKEEFTKKDLKIGMLVEIRQGWFYLVENDRLVRGNGYLTFSNIQTDLTNMYHKNFDIIRVYEVPTNIHLMMRLEDIKDKKILWERKEIKEDINLEDRKENVDILRNKSIKEIKEDINLEDRKEIKEDILRNKSIKEIITISDKYRYVVLDINLVLDVITYENEDGVRETQKVSDFIAKHTKLNYRNW